MSKPPEELDGAKVLEWAWSGEEPFGVLHYTTGEIAHQIYGLAICQYSDSDTVYRFSCDQHWEVEQDAEYLSISAAKKQLPDQYKQIEAKWNKY